MEVDDVTDLDIHYQGPFSWPGREPITSLPPIPDSHGVYLLTAPYADGYVLYMAGYTTRSFRKRFAEHTRYYRKGEYTILDIASMSAGIRREVWHGWSLRPSSSPARAAEWLANQDELQPAIDRQLDGFRIFVTDVSKLPPIPGFHNRLEYSLMTTLSLQRRPFCDIMDHGMSLRSRKSGEKAIIVRNICDHKIYGMVGRMII